MPVDYPKSFDRKRGFVVGTLCANIFKVYEKFFEHAVMCAALDVRSAFYVVLRELLLPMDMSLQLLLEDLDVPLLFQQPLLTLMQQPAIIPDLTDNDHLVSNLAEAYTKAWFMVKGTDEVAYSRLGVPPGDQLADHMYNISVRLMIADYHC